MNRQKNIDGFVDKRRLRKLFIFFVAAKNESFQRTLVRRNDSFFTRLEYEAFYESIDINALHNIFLFF